MADATLKATAPSVIADSAVGVLQLASAVCFACEIPLEVFTEVLCQGVITEGRQNNFTGVGTAAVLGRTRGWLFRRRDIKKILAKHGYRGPLHPQVFEEILIHPGCTCGELAETFEKSEDRILEVLKTLTRSKKIKIANGAIRPARYEALTRHYEHPTGKTNAERVPRALRAMTVAHAAATEAEAGAMRSVVGEFTEDGAKWLEREALGELDRILTRAALVRVEDESFECSASPPKYNFSTLLASAPVTCKSCPKLHALAAAQSYCGMLIPRDPLAWVWPDTAKLGDDYQQLFVAREWNALCAELESLVERASRIGSGARQLYQVTAMYAHVGV